MNWLYIIVMAYIVLSALRGYHRGIIKVVYSVVALLVTSAFVGFMTPLISHTLQKCTPVYESIETGCENYARTKIRQKLDEDGSLENVYRLPDSIVPGNLQNILKHGSRQVIEDTLESQEIYQKIARTAAGFCTNLIAFVMSLVVIQLILIKIGKELNYFAKTPGIHIINMIMGFFAGIVRAFIVIWLVFLIIKITALLPVSTALIGLIEENAVLRELYEQNYLLKLLEKMPVLIAHK